MADVIRLVDHTPRPARKPGATPKPAEAAVILFFSGIRYERLDVAKTAVSGAAASSTPAH